MDKIHSIRTALAAAVPDLERNPECLLVFVDKGSIAATAVPGLSFRYNYTLNLILTDYAGSPDIVIVALLQWLSINQIDILMNPDRNKSAITFDVDVISNRLVDLSMTLQLTESVGVSARPGGGFNMVHHPEPDFGQSAGFPSRMEIFANGVLVAVIGHQ